MTAFPGEMSGGEQRRVVIARALINEPKLLLGDEPTSDLDEETEEEIFALLDDLRREENFAVALVTHNHALAQRADRMFEMRQGILLPSDGRRGRLQSRADPAPRRVRVKNPAPCAARWTALGDSKNSARRYGRQRDASSPPGLISSRLRQITGWRAINNMSLTPIGSDSPRSRTGDVHPAERRRVNFAARRWPL